MGEFEMPELLFGRWDKSLKEIAAALSRYEAAHPEADVTLYRQNSASVRIRVLDSSFSNLSIGERSKLVWPYLRRLPEDVRSQITVLLLLGHDEAATSFANAEFDSPLPSVL
jgi:hypothetical protein